MDTWEGIILHPPADLWDYFVVSIFGKKSVPKRRHLVDEIELEIEMAQRAISREKKLESEGWGVVGV